MVYFEESANGQTPDALFSSVNLTLNGGLSKDTVKKPPFLRLATPGTSGSLWAVGHGGASF